MSILQISLSISTTQQSLSSAKSLSGCPISAQSLSLTRKFSQLSFNPPSKSTAIRMGGGPRTYPGGVSKWQWKRMQAKKSKQLLQARLARERQIYEMRKRAELKAAVSELERPWETVEKPPNLFSVSADEQLKVLADRFQKPGGLDLWSERDGPELFRHDNGLPSARFFPKGVVHSVKPYGQLENSSHQSEEFKKFSLEEDSANSESGGELSLRRNGYDKNSTNTRRNSDKGRNFSTSVPRRLESIAKEGQNGNSKGKITKKSSRQTHLNDSEGINVRDTGFRNSNYKNKPKPGTNAGEFSRSNENVNSEVFDMNLRNDGSYGFEWTEDDDAYDVVIEQLWPDKTIS